VKYNKKESRNVWVKQVVRLPEFPFFEDFKVNGSWDDLVMKFADAASYPADVQPIDVLEISSGEFALVHGRTRHCAAIYCQIDSIKVNILNHDSNDCMLWHAFVHLVSNHKKATPSQLAWWMASVEAYRPSVMFSPMGVEFTYEQALQFKECYGIESAMIISKSLTNDDQTELIMGTKKAAIWLL